MFLHWGSAVSNPLVCESPDEVGAPLRQKRFTLIGRSSIADARDKEICASKQTTTACENKVNYVQF